MSWLPLWTTLRTSTGRDWAADLSAGLTTAVMLVPQAMAYAMLAGLDPIVGLYASTVPLALYALFGSSRVLAVGPVAMDSLMVAAALAPMVQGDALAYALHAAALALLVGAIQLGMGIARLGILVRFLARPVLVGFTAAAAVIIGLSQLGSATGMSLPRSQQVHVILNAAWMELGSVHALTFGMALASVSVLLLLKAWAPRVPRFLLVVVLGTLATWWLGLDQAGLAIVGEVPAGLPAVVLPMIPFDHVMDLLPVAFAIALVAMMEAIAVGKRYDADLVPNRELMSLGLANLGSGLVGGYPITGGFSRTAVNAQAGARSVLAGLITAGVVVLTLLFLTGSFYFLPKAVLASIILTAVVGLVDTRAFVELWQTAPLDFAVAGITGLATLTLGIQLGMLTGIIASGLVYGWKRLKPALYGASEASEVRGKR